MTEPQEHLNELVERAAAAWWNAEKDGKRIATRGWHEIPEEWKLDYRMRMKAAVLALGMWP